MIRKGFNISQVGNFIAQDAQEVMNGQEILSELLDVNEKRTQNTHNTQEVQKVQKNGTQGRKGQKLPRINMAFFEDNLEFLQLISRVYGKSMTAYVNELIEKDRIEKSDIIKEAKKVFR